MDHKKAVLIVLALLVVFGGVTLLYVSTVSGDGISSGRAPAGGAIAAIAGAVAAIAARRNHRKKKQDHT